jgi:hypothetical protein
MVANKAILQEIAEAFPPVPKPEGMALMFHEEGCLKCVLLQRDFEKYAGSTLPNEAVRWVHNELSCFSPAGWKWLMHSYLRRCVTQDTGSDPVETQFLIYHLSPAPEYTAETREHLSQLSRRQLDCLRHFLECCQEHPHWSDYCRDDIARGLEFVATLQPVGG